MLSKAYACIEELRNRMPSVNLSLYIEPTVLVQIGKAVGVDLTPKTAPANHHSMGGNDEEEVAMVDD